MIHHQDYQFNCIVLTNAKLKKLIIAAIK